MFFYVTPIIICGFLLLTHNRNVEQTNNESIDRTLTETLSDPLDDVDGLNYMRFQENRKELFKSDFQKEKGRLPLPFNDWPEFDWRFPH